ncbi:MAG: hypothetical protein HY332_06785 [Chloroflexi bacterium]|nr:hypothetical protein [Chloroflexota bacterium]
MVAVFTGWFTYHWVAAQYTRALVGPGHESMGRADWSWPPTNSSLGNIHGELLYRAGIPEAIPPENAPRIRQMVYDERAANVRGWLGLSAAGLPVVVVVVAAVLLWPRAGNRAKPGGGAIPAHAAAMGLLFAPLLIAPGTAARQAGRSVQRPPAR